MTKDIKSIEEAETFKDDFTPTYSDQIMLELYESEQLNLHKLIKEKVESELKKIMQVPWIMALVSVLVLCVFYTGDVKMLVLSLYIVHYLAIHQ